MARTGNVPHLTEPVSVQPGQQSGTDVLGGRYRLERVIGRGGMAVVHQGKDLVLDRPVAVKVFRTDGVEADASGYEHEARVLAGLNSSGLVTVFDAGVDAADGTFTPFLVMEYVPGATLADVLRDGPLGAGEVARLGCELATALAYVHRHGVVHRDVKPANILLPALEDDEPAHQLDAKLTDFGISRLVTGGHITSSQRLGTVAYLSPEQVRGADVGPASDVYALGLVLAECLSGTPVFPGDDVDAAAARLHEPPQFAADVPPEWGRLLRDMLDLEPARRPTAAEVSVALSGLIMASGAAPAALAPATVTSVDEAPATAAQAMSGAPSSVEASTAEASAELGDAPTTAIPTEGVGPQPTRVLDFPAAAVDSHRAARRWRVAVSWPIVAAAVAAIVVFVIIAAVTGPIHTPQVARPPAYPAVPGQLGTDLAKLQQQVRP